MIRFCLLASGSKGNAALLEVNRTRILIDAGISGRDLVRRLSQVGIDGNDLDALVITHEHTDHVRGLGPLVRGFDLPVYLHTAIASRLAVNGKAGAVREFAEGDAWQVGDVEVRAFSVNHDATSPVGFTFSCEAGKIGLATDLGAATRLVEQQLMGCRALVLETNHDESMLRSGPYPWPLKQRVRSRHGHLSNPAAAELLDGLLWDGLEALVLAHLSETNNRPILARQAIDAVLGHQTLCDPGVTIGSQSSPTAWIELD